MNNNILFIAPSNSIHSLKWIKYIQQNSKLKITWVSFYKRTIEDDKFSKNIEYFEFTSSNPLKVYTSLKLLYNKRFFFCTHLHYLGRHSYLLIFLKIQNLIVSPWGSDIKFLKLNFLKKQSIKLLLLKSKLITVDADYMVKLVKGIVNKKVEIARINFGTDTNRFAYSEPEFSSEKIKIISLRNLEKIYSIETLIKATKIVIERNIDLKVDIYGTGSELSFLKNLINQLGLNQIIKLKGRFDYNTLPSILKSYNMYVSTSTSDAGLSASTSEAMSVGLFPIISDNSENSYWMSENSGLLFSTSSYEDLANKILFYNNLKFTERKAISLNARNKIVLFNSYENEMNKILTIYKKYNE
jgi:glycosyltransferase involved in cell wall biosynthesis